MSEIQDWLVGFVSAPDFVERYPYYAAILARMTPIDDPSTPYAAVSWSEGRLFLHVNVATLQKNPQYLRGLLLHEVHHIVLGHLTNERFDSLAHLDLIKLAKEASANEYIRESLPEGAITCDRLRSYGVRGGQSTLERYEMLAWFRQQGMGPVGATGVHLCASPSRVLRTPVTPPAPVEEIGRILTEAIAEVRTRGPAPTGNESLVAGHDAGSLIELLADNHAEPPKPPTNWRAALQRLQERLRTPQHVHTWPNRRFPEAVGRIPGRVYRRGTVSKPSILVAIDTSASMATAELEHVGRQLALMADSARLTVVECDTRIRRVYAFSGRLSHVVGRGGTDLRPVFAPPFLAEHDTAAVVYFTDGVGPWPESKPRPPTLWVLTKPIEFACPWGEKVRLQSA